MFVDAPTAALFEMSTLPPTITVDCARFTFGLEAEVAGDVHP